MNTPVTKTEEDFNFEKDLQDKIDFLFSCGQQSPDAENDPELELYREILEECYE